MTTKFMEPGTDATQDLSFFSATTGAASSDSAQQHTGARSLKLDTAAGNVLAYAARSGVLADTGRRISVWFRFDALPSLASSIFYVLKADGSSIVFQINIGTTGILSVTGGNPVSGTTVLAVNTWYRLSFSYYVTNTTTFASKLYLNGVLEITQSQGTLPNTGSDTIQFRKGVNWGASKVSWYDDIIIDDGADSSAQPDLGDVRVTVKRPNANGTTNGFTTQVGSGGSGYGTGHAPQVNEQPLSQTNGWANVGAGAAVTEAYTVEDALTGSVNVSGLPVVDVGGWVFAKALAPETAQILVDGASSSIALTSTPTLFVKYKGSTSLPAGAGTDIGIVTDTSLTTVSLYECGLLIAFRQVTASVGATSGAGVALATGAAISSAIGAASGAATALATGGAITSAVGATSGAATALATGRATAAGIGAASGAATATGITGAITAAGVGAASGAAMAVATGAATMEGVGGSAGVSTATSTGAATLESVGSAAGAAAGTGVGAATGTGVGAAAGVATALATSVGTVSGIGAAAGVSSATAASLIIANGVGVSAGLGTATASAARLLNGVGLSVGAGSAQAFSQVLAASVGHAAGRGDAAAFSPNTAACDYLTMCERLDAELTAALDGTYAGIVVSTRVYDPARLPAFTRYCVIISPASRPWSERHVSVRQIQYTFHADLYVLVHNFDEVEAVYGPLGLLQLVEDIKTTLRSSTLSGLLYKTYDEPGGEVTVGRVVSGGLDSAAHVWVHRARIPYTGLIQPFEVTLAEPVVAEVPTMATTPTVLCERVRDELLAGLFSHYLDLVVDTRLWDPARLPDFDRYCIVVAPHGVLSTERRVSLETIQYGFHADLHLLVHNFEDSDSVFGKIDGRLGLIQLIDDAKVVLRSSTLTGLLDKTYDEPGGPVQFEMRQVTLASGAHIWLQHAVIPYLGLMRPFSPTPV